MLETQSYYSIIQKAKEKYPSGICYQGNLSQNELSEMQKECSVHFESSGSSTTYYIMFKGKSAKKQMRCDTITTQSQYSRTVREFNQFCHSQKQTSKKCSQCKYHVRGIDCWDVWMFSMLEPMPLQQCM